MKLLQIRVTGQVQGVNFRYATKQKASELGINGFVRNESDGSVYVEAEGEADEVEKLAQWCTQGPSRAEVSGVEVMSSELKGFQGFEIRH